MINANANANPKRTSKYKKRKKAIPYKVRIIERAHFTFRTAKDSNPSDNNNYNTVILYSLQVVLEKYNLTDNATYELYDLCGVNYDQFQVLAQHILDDEGIMGPEGALAPTKKFRSRLSLSKNTFGCA